MCTALHLRLCCSRVVGILFCAAGNGETYNTPGQGGSRPREARGATEPGDEGACRAPTGMYSCALHVWPLRHVLAAMQLTTAGDLRPECASDVFDVNCTQMLDQLRGILAPGSASASRVVAPAATPPAAMSPAATPPAPVSPAATPPAPVSPAATPPAPVSPAAEAPAKRHAPAENPV
jgi:hypothetical protein